MTALKTKSARTDELERTLAFAARLCARCNHPANKHIHLFGSAEWLCPTVATFVEPLPFTENK